MKSSIKDLFASELHYILSAEEQILKALPAMITAAHSSELKEAFESHLQETREQVQRLKKIFRTLKIERKAKTCKAMKALLQECNEVLQIWETKSSVRDSALISRVQRVEHFEISAYGTVRTLAAEIGLDKVSDLLQDTLDEEASADKKLTKLAKGGLITAGINRQANMETPVSQKQIIQQPRKTATAKRKSVRRTTGTTARSSAAARASTRARTRTSMAARGGARRSSARR